MITTPHIAYSQKKDDDKLVQKVPRKSKRRLRAEQARMQRWEREFMEYLNRKQRGNMYKRRRIRRAATLYAQPDPYAGRRFRTEGEKVGQNPNIVRTEPGKRGPRFELRRIKPRTTSGRYTVQRRAKPYRFRGKDKWEDPYDGKFYGRRKGIKPRNTQQVRFTGTVKPYRKRGRLGDKPYSGYQGKNYISATKKGERAWRGDIAGNRVKQRKPGNQPRFTGPNFSPYATRSGDKDGKDKPAKSGRVKVRSATKQFIVNKKARPYFLKDRKKWEETYTGKYYGRKAGIAPRNTQRVSVTPQPNPYRKRGRMGDKPYVGKMQGGYITATKKGEQAWKGDISGHKLRKSKIRDNQQVGRRIGKRAVGAMSATGGLHNNQGRSVNRTGAGGSITGQIKRNNRGQAIPSFIPSGEARRSTLFSGNLKGRKPLKAGGSISSRMNRNNNGRAIASFIPSGEARGAPLFSGTLKARKPLKGGGSITSKMKRDNDGQAIASFIPGGEARRASLFSGNIKARRPVKGGGSMSSRMVRDNNGRAITSGKTYDQSPQRYSGNILADELRFRFDGSYLNYSGNIKARRPLKGGGSISGEMVRDNNGRALISDKSYDQKPQRYSGNILADELRFRFDGSYLNYSGNIKARRPQKGGGSVKRGIWNNDEKPLARKYTGGNVREIGAFSGNMKARRPEKGGGSFNRNGWNNDEKPLARKYTGANVRAIGSFSGNMKASRPEKGGGTATRSETWNNNESALARKFDRDKFTLYSGNYKRTTDYARNKNSDENALMVRKPGRNYYAGANFTGNMRREKRQISGKMHTSTVFFNSKKDQSSTDEKNKKFSFKLLWNKLFGNSQPEPDKVRRPRYDKGEKGLWNE